MLSARTQHDFSFRRFREVESGDFAQSTEADAAVEVEALPSEAERMRRLMVLEATVAWSDQWAYIACSAGMASEANAKLH